MTHDPMCDEHTIVPRAGWHCHCALIARVREDERQMRDRVWDAGWEKGRADALAAAREAVVEVHRKWGYPQQLIDSNVIIAAIDALRGDA
jgi:hypothetical protein